MEIYDSNKCEFVRVYIDIDEIIDINQVDTKNIKRKDETYYVSLLMMDGLYWIQVEKFPIQ